jgi:hypothetical protein
MVINDYSLIGRGFFLPVVRQKTNQHTQAKSNNLRTPGPAAEWWIVQVCKKKEEKQLSLSSCSLFFCVREITSHTKILPEKLSRET